MRSLRYRIVTLCSVMLALAAGIILGNGPLQGDDTVATVSGSGDQDELAAAEQQIEEQQDDLAFADSYADRDRRRPGGPQARGPRGDRGAPSPGPTPRPSTALASTVGAGRRHRRRAGARSTRSSSTWRQRQLVAELARQMDVGATKKAVQVPAEAGDYGRVSRLLAYALLTGDNGGDQPDRVAQGIMAGLTTAELVSARRAT